MLAHFEKKLHPYPDADPAPPPRGLLPFVWACTKGSRGFILWMTLLTAAIGAFEALLFGMLGSIVDWLGATDPARLWDTRRTERKAILPTRVKITLTTQDETGKEVKYVTQSRVMLNTEFPRFQ